MKAKKAISCILAALLLTMAAGCGGSSTSSSPGGESASGETAQQSASIPAAADKKIEMEIWTGPDWKGVYDPTEFGADFTDFLSFAAEEYAREHPNVKITPVLIDGAQRAEKISIAMQSGTLPNLYCESSFAMSDYIHEGLMEPIDDIITGEDRADIPQALFDICTVDGKVYFFPFSTEVGMVAVNVSLFREAGVEDVLPEGIQCLH